MVNDLNVTTRRLEPRWCHQHERLECARIHWADDPDIKIKVPRAVCCHFVATEGPWCPDHVPAPEPVTAPKP